MITALIIVGFSVAAAAALALGWLGGWLAGWQRGRAFGWQEGYFRRNDEREAARDMLGRFAPLAGKRGAK